MNNDKPTAFSVPVVDISAYVQDGTPAEREKVAKAMDDACSTVGFIQVTGHGIDDSVTDGLASAMDDFFGLDLESKKGYKVEGANRGYTAPKTESLSLSAGVEAASRMNDFFEAYNVGVEARSFTDLDLDEGDYGVNVWPQIEGYRDRVQTYFAEASRVAYTLTSIFADALGLESDFFDRITDHSIDVLRMNNYALPPGTEVTLDGDLTGMGEHTDFGIVTVLWADQVRGLQVLGRDGAWNDVSPADGALLINLGDLTARLTNDRWMSTLHRVKPPVVNGTIERRRSAAFFRDGNADAVISTLPSHLEYDNGMAYEPILVTDHIAAKLAGSRGGKLNAAAVREAARLREAATR
ncbi:2-oxoglutarate and iron-dependent oxygenase domain-containing protein [Gordonia jinhuaensis]|uniref:2OG-Fe(II) oxygenase n=1 Tax=Gordonia jinhuaensis TaxID=1517702 RepID=A0A916TFE3_9ACTN|nr:isopenicillin N synthase family oxygenase [Gordonia jinhuaensis]GGB42435.1 2OG-Fe(II) oxygenase [Gordonia jinhuaensis]